MSILYQNFEKTVTLIDIPTSIAVAQGGPSSLLEKNLLSSEPLRDPFCILNEPKSSSACAEHFTNTAEKHFHDEVKGLVQRALEEIKDHYSEVWHLPRIYTVQWKHGTSSKRKSSVDDARQPVEDGANTHIKETAIIKGVFDHHPENEVSPSQPEPDSRVISLDSNSFQSNISETLVLFSSPSTPSATYRIPPRSAFILSNIEHSIDTFRSATARHLSSPTRSSGPRQFDFILLDPPWPNASAKRSRSYLTPKTIQQTRELLLSLEVENYLSPFGIVGIWVTNKSAIRELVLGKVSQHLDSVSQGVAAGEKNSSSLAGLFDYWNVEWIEEWIWIKTTASGQPITDLDSTWRKPYEILLLGRRRSDFDDVQQSSPPNDDSQTKQRRVIAGVPDLHSRKPSLKELISPFMPDPQDYRALEVFARNLTAGWWAWGNEVLKFNEDSFWRARGHGSPGP
ncbi:MAG: hypothetical protein M1837_001142 [Sclerophora amabilis]|nr:MAG: hypothetical protein M1837_001142 [Sclerophora amabilis]